ncbi:MAG: prephenate dehydrogenase/arogenate dehydrogenase family protein [Desulfobacteraceae bacterium]|nr:prephenate dehydrogenase/arogenate dehydrogenase family protein [Desulfobacteraceae bacterium]
MSNIRIGIIGGKGAMGRWFEKFFTQAGHKVLISDLRTMFTSKFLVRVCDIIIISVPLDAAPEIAKDIGHRMSRHQVLSDICSLKEDIVNAMFESADAEVVGMHPLFGPFADSICGQNVVLCPARGETWADWLQAEFERYGAKISRMDAGSHDRNMAIFQGLTHLLSISIGRMLQKTDMHPAQAISHCTPVFRVNMDLVGRLFAQDLGLYERLIGQNKYVGQILNIFLSALEESREKLLSGQLGNGTEFLTEIRSFLGNFCEQGLNESNEFLNAFYLNVSSKHTDSL